MSSTWHYYNQDLDRYERELDAIEYEGLAKDPSKRKRVNHGFFTLEETEEGSITPEPEARRAGSPTASAAALSSVHGGLRFANPPYILTPRNTDRPLEPVIGRRLAPTRWRLRMMWRIRTHRIDQRLTPSPRSPPAPSAATSAGCRSACPARCGRRWRPPP